MAPQPTDPQPYVVREGDTLSVLAYQRGADATAIWNDPSNADLKASRCSMDLLHPGDVLRLPPPKETFLAVSVGAVNKFRAPAAVWQPYPAIVLGQSSGKPNVANVLIRAMMPWQDAITTFTLNGTTLKADKDYFADGGTVFFRPTGDVSGTLSGKVTFDGGGVHSFTAAIASSLTEKVESLYAQSLNVRAFARAVREKMTQGGRESCETAALSQNVLLTAWHARQVVVTELEKDVPDADWSAFQRNVLALPELRE